MQPTPTSQPADLESRLAWLRHVESMDEAVAQRQLRARLRSDATRARSELRALQPWSSMSPTVRDMLARDAEAVRLHRIVETVPVGARILDIGCGPGVVAGTLTLHERPAAYFGIDLSEPKIASARDMAATNQLDDRVRFAVGDARELPADTIAELAPDTVLILEVLEHLQDPTAVLSSIADIVPDDATITFSVPILGRIEACWGHRTLYGADAIVGLADACGLGIVDVDEVHNTWALATVCRRHAIREQEPGVRPVTIKHVTAPRISASEAETALLTDPARLQLTLAPQQTARLDADTPGADWIRVDIECEPPGSLERLEIVTYDGDGDVVRRWVPELGRLSETGRRTIVARPQQAAVPPSPRSAPASRAQLLLSTTPSEGAVVTLWRLGYASGYERLLPPPTVPPPAPAEPAPRAITRRAAVSDDVLQRSASSADRAAEIVTDAARAITTRWPRFRRPAVAVRDRLRAMRDR